MEGRVSTPQTAPGVHKRARQSKAKRKFNMKPDIGYKDLSSVLTALPFAQCIALFVLPNKHPANGCGGSATATAPGCKQTKKDDQGRLYPKSYGTIRSSLQHLMHVNVVITIVDYVPVLETSVPVE
jgi:hypothetical protein